MIRVKKAARYIGQGISAPKAMVKAGFTPQYANNISRNSTSQTHVILRQISEDYRLRFACTFLKKCKPEEQAEVLADMVKSKKKTTRDFDKIQAIRTGHLVICKNGDNFPPNINAQQAFFIIPQSVENWDNPPDTSTPAI